MGDTLFLILRRLRYPLITLILVYSVSIAGMVLIPGVDPDGQPWRMDIFHAFYVMSYTATTIGFGELPHPYNEAQRLWVTLAIYLSVIGWAYALTSVLALSRDTAFRAALARSRFNRRVGRLDRPFCVLCGYGRSGSAIAHALDRMGLRSVVLEANEERAAGIAIEDFSEPPLVLVADARRPGVLRDAGIAKAQCRAVLALTGDDEANQAIAIGVKVLDRDKAVIAKVADAAAQVDLGTFGDVQLINPYQTFATNMGLDFAAPAVLQVEEWLTGVPDSERPEKLRLPHGHWVLAGYGRFGRAIGAELDAAGISWKAFDPRQHHLEGTSDRVIVCGSTEEGLVACGIDHAVGLVAGTDSDTANLATVTVARRRKANLEIVIRQNKAYNRSLIVAARARVEFVQSDLMIHEVLQVLTTPLLDRFLALVRRDAADLARRTAALLDEQFGRRVPAVWTLECDVEQPGMHQALRLSDSPLLLRELLIDPRDPAATLQAVPLLRVSGRDQQPLPHGDTQLSAGDWILFAGRPGVEALQRHFLLDPTPIDLVRTGREPARSAVFRWIERRVRRPETRQDGPKGGTGTNGTFR
jgi:voltage-gated potassium channel